MLSSAPVVNSLGIQKSAPSKVSPFEAQKSFSSFLKESIEKVNEAQIESDQLTEKLAYRTRCRFTSSYDCFTKIKCNDAINIGNKK